MLFGYVDSIIIGIFMSAKYVGFYAAAMTIAEGVGALVAFPNVLLPIFTRLKKKRLQNAFDIVFRYASLLAIPMAFGIIALGNYIIRTIYGYNYLPAVLPLYFLSFLVLEGAITYSFESLFFAQEKPKYFVNILIAANIINIILNYFLITSLLKISPEMAIAGAAIATVTSKIFYMIALGIYSKKKFKVKLSSLHIVRPLFAAVIMAASILLINRFVKLNIFIGLLEILFGMAVYLIVMLIIKGICKEDYFLIKNVIKNKI